MSPARSEVDGPLVAVVIPAHDEAGKVGRVLDKLPRDGHFEAIVVDDGSSDGTADEARAHGADVVLHWPTRRGVGAAIRAGWSCGIERGRPYLALVGGDDQHEPAELVSAFDALRTSGADYVQGSRRMPGGRTPGAWRSRRIANLLYAVAFSALARRRVTDASNGFRIFRASLLSDPTIDLSQGWLDGYELEPYLLYKAVRRHRVIEVPVTVAFHNVQPTTKLCAVHSWCRLIRPVVLLAIGARR
ncbi:MAG: glycosyltransferase family 2 protein [Gaiellaceae bacterium]